MQIFQKGYCKFNSSLPLNLFKSVKHLDELLYQANDAYNIVFFSLIIDRNTCIFHHPSDLYAEYTYNFCLKYSKN